MNVHYPLINPSGLPFEREDLLRLVRLQKLLDFLHETRDVCGLPVLKVPQWPGLGNDPEQVSHGVLLRVLAVLFLLCPVSVGVCGLFMVVIIQDGVEARGWMERKKNDMLLRIKN